MLRPWALKGPADGAQCLPAALLGYRRQPEFGGHDRRRLLRRPHPAVVGRELDPLAHRRENLGRQDFRLGAVALAPVAEARRTEAIVAFDKFLDPAPHEAGQPRHLGAAPPLRQQPDHLVVPGQRRILAFPPARLKLGNAEMIYNLHHARPLVPVGRHITAIRSPRESSPRRVN
jgi:hypothetical protein